LNKPRIYLRQHTRRTARFKVDALPRGATPHFKVVQKLVFCSGRVLGLAAQARSRRDFSPFWRRSFSRAHINRAFQTIRNLVDVVRRGLRIPQSLRGIGRLVAPVTYIACASCDGESRCSNANSERKDAVAGMI
jgi:hypothetical protein